MEDKGQILLYQTPDGESRIEVRLEGETLRNSRNKGRHVVVLVGENLGY